MLSALSDQPVNEPLSSDAAKKNRLKSKNYDLICPDTEAGINSTVMMPEWEKQNYNTAKQCTRSVTFLLSQKTVSVIS